MKYVPLPRLKEGMALGQDIYDGSGEVLLRKHYIVDKDCVHNLEEWGFPGIYIDDEFSKQVEIDTLVRPELLHQAQKLVAAVYEEKHGTNEDEETRIRQVVEEIVDDIASDEELMYNLMNIRSYDNSTYDHSLQVCMLSVLIGARMGMDKARLKELATAALMHDIGKKIIHIELLHTKEPLSDAEKRRMHEHVEAGYQYLKKDFHFSDAVCTAVLEHHENYDGSGYPHGKKGSEISPLAAIIRVADTYDAMTSKRPYRDGYTPSSTAEYIMAQDGAKFAPDVVSVFTKWVSVYPAGCEVELSDGRLAVVIKNYPNFTLRPLVKVMGTGDMLDLKLDASVRNITIIDMVH